jgi:membrane protein implicated in regulation of membrane protease activity
MIRLILRPFTWTFWLLLDTILTIGIVSFGSPGNFLLIPSVIAICLGLAMETHPLYGVLVFALFILMVMAETRFDECIREDLLKYRRQPQPLFGKRR